MPISEEELQPSCPICGAQPVYTDEHQKFMICKECGHKENFGDFMEEFEAKTLDKVERSLTKSLEKVFKGNKNIKFKKR
jgi:transcription initiation factor TFIIIB Brf1 subunit/transcription initiation factor TFIIB